MSDDPSLHAPDAVTPPPAAPPTQPPAAPDAAAPPPAAPPTTPDAAPTFSIAFDPGVTVTKWSRLWAERQPDVPLNVFRSEPGESVAVIHDSRADVSFVRLPVNTTGLSLIALYREVPVAIVPKDHAAAAYDELSVTDLADEHLLQNPDDVPEWRDVADEVREQTRRPLRGIHSLDDAVEQAAAGVGIVIVPQSLARLHTRKDVVYRPLTDVAETQVSLAWAEGVPSALIEEFIGIVRGRSASSSRAAAAISAAAEGAAAASAAEGRGAARARPEKKIGPVAKAKAKARAAAEAEAATSGKKKAAAPVQKKRQTQQADAAQARRRKFGGKR